MTNKDKQRNTTVQRSEALTEPLTEPLIESLDAPRRPKRVKWHIDEWLDGAVCDVIDNPSLGYAHFMFWHFRAPAWVKMAHRPYMKDRRLFVTYEGKRYRVTGASRLGDIWLAKDFNREDGYDLRIDLDFSKLSDWSDKP